MAQEYTMMHDIVSQHSERMQNLKRYYPFFRLQENSLAQFKDGQFGHLDMGYIVFAVLRFFIEENQFNDANVTYAMYEAFMKDFLSQEYGVSAQDAGKDLILYIFDKLCNEGRPFVYTYYDPQVKKSVEARVKLIDSRFEDNELVYFLTSDAIEFYLDTKEVKDESRITTEQLLLEKMIRLKNFRGGLDVIRRINGEVGRLMVEKDEVVRLLHHNVFEGVRALEEFSGTGLAWFEEEQKLFASNKELVDKALLKAESGQHPGADGYTPEDIYQLEHELKRAIRRHSDLLAACTQLQLEADEIISRAKHSRFRSVFSFDDFLGRMVSRENAGALEAFVKPLMDMNLHKSFNLYQLDDLLDYKPEEQEKGEKVGTGREQMYVYEDDAAEARISSNFDLFLRVLFEQLKSRGSFDLKFLNHMYEMKFTENILKNGDYYAFIVHLSQKKEYRLDKIKKEQDTFLEGIIARYLEKRGDGAFDGLSFSLEFVPEDILRLGDTFTVSNIRFTSPAGAAERAAEMAEDGVAARSAAVVSATTGGRKISGGTKDGK